MASANDFTRDSLLGTEGVYAEFYKGDFQGHVFRGNQHSSGGIGHFDPYNAVFTTICASGHQNTVKVPPAWIGRNADGSFNGSFTSGASQKNVCATCSRPLANRWRLVNGRQFLPKPTPPASVEQWLATSTPKYVK